MPEKIIQDFLFLWATIDPIGTLAIFTALTAHISQEERRRIALRASFYAFCVLMAAIVVGQIILTGLGIRLISLQLAGGVILFLFALQMIFGDEKEHLKAHKESGHDIAVFPLAIPSIATPGAIMAAIVQTDNHLYSIAHQAMTAAIMTLILGITCAFMLLSHRILRVIGKNGADILVKIMGMLLAALSVELIMEALGVERWLRPIAA